MRFIDFSFQSNHNDSKSMLGYIFILNSGAIYWKNFKQHIIANYVCEAEYIMAFDATKRAIWL